MAYNRWNKQSYLVRWLFISSFMCTFLIFVESSALSSQQSISPILKDVSTSADEESSVCLTPGCIQIASIYLKRANLSADPCQDFYNFACGQFEADTVIPDDEAEQTSFTEANDDLNDRLKNLLESPPDSNENKVFGKVRAYYNSCLNKTEFNILKEKPLNDLLQKLGGWPVLEGEKWTSEDEENFDWIKTTYDLRELGLSHNLLVSVSVTVDIRNSSRLIIQVGEPSLGMDRTHLIKGLNDTKVQKYLKLMVDIAELLGADRDTAETELTDALEFEIKLGKLKLAEEDKRNYTELYNKSTFHELQRIAPFVNWVEFSNRLLKADADENEVIILSAPKYLGNLTNLLKETPKRTIANYMLWRTSLSVVNSLDDRFRNVVLDYAAALTGQSTDQPRWKICTKAALNAFGNALGALYVRNYFDDKDKDKVVAVENDIRQEFISILKSIDWMDPITQERALTKINAMVQMIAYPVELLNDTVLEDYYRNISVENKSFFDASLHISKQLTDYTYGKLREARERTDWRDLGAVADVGAFYAPPLNLIIVPAGILQGVFYGREYPSYVNYGTIGFIVGHEITHGFDDQGRQYDDAGSLKLWWEPETDLKFQNKTKCMIDQYSNYKVASIDMNVNGIITQGENVADNGGAKEAYRAYEKWVDKNGEEKSLPGLKYTPRQLFWLSFANVWCSKTKLQSVANAIATDNHSPQIFRVNGVVSNSKEFSEDFNCPAGAPMNPDNKCEVW